MTKATRSQLIEAALIGVPHGICVWDRDFRIVVCNEAYASLRGIAPDVLGPGATLTEALAASVAAGNYPGRTVEQVEAAYRARLKGKGGRSVVTIERVTGTGRTLRIVHTPLPDGAWLSTHEDVSELKGYLAALEKREEELLVHNMRFEHAINNMPQGLCMFDGDMRLLVWNRQYTEMYKIPPDGLRRGDSLEKVLRQRVEAGNVPVGGGDAFVSNRLALTEEGNAASFVVEMDDGRVISVQHQPLADGGWVATHCDVTEQRRSEERIHYLAHHDALTGLPNRFLLNEHLDALQARVDEGEIMAVLCIDLDHFKGVNDTLGHAVGDEVLKEVAARLVACKRDTDIAARLGGDEFTILYGPLARVEDAAILAKRIVEAISRPFVVQGHQIAIGASVGGAVAPLDGRTAEALLKAADAACYRAKSDGRGTFGFFEHSLDAAAGERRRLGQWLRTALPNGQLSLDYQPIYDLGTGRVAALEALLRWRHPERGPISPAEFIPVAEESGLILQIGEWVLRNACAEACLWPRAVKLSVNLSAVQFSRCDDLAGMVVSAAAGAGLDLARLELELTESVVQQGNGNVQRTLERLRALGVAVCMDDFGTGYCSLAHLRSFPLDKIKIDRVLVQDASERSGEAIVQAIVGLGASLGVAVTAEGVETAEQLAAVKEQGCAQAQGYLLGRPLPAAAVADLFAVEQFSDEHDIMRMPRSTRLALSA